MCYKVFSLWVVRAEITGNPVDLLGFFVCLLVLSPKFLCLASDSFGHTDTDYYLAKNLWKPFFRAPELSHWSPLGLKILVVLISLTFNFYFLNSAKPLVFIWLSPLLAVASQSCPDSGLWKLKGSPSLFPFHSRKHTLGISCYPMFENTVSYILSNFLIVEGERENPLHHFWSSRSPRTVFQNS